MYRLSVTSPQDLLARLSRFGAPPVPASELRGALGVSPATLSRLVAAAGDEVARLGRARAAAYARTRAIEGLGRRLPVFRVGRDGTPSQTGELRLLWERSTWLEEAGAPGGWFTGLPPPVADQAPQGYLGRGFARRHPDLRLPARLEDWSDDDRLRALALRGEDGPGDLILGAGSLARFAAWDPPEVTVADFPALARRSAEDERGSSAGGERPKFGALRAGRHVLVKFAGPGDDQVARRWRDLLWCEAAAARTIAASGCAQAAEVALHDVAGWRFLEAVRFDRVGERGRAPVLSLEAIANEYLGDRRSWTAAAAALSSRGASPFRLPPAEADRLRWLDAFGQLTGNTDRHFGNVTFLVEGGDTLRVAPAYDMLPMTLAPSAEQVVQRPFAPAPPTGEDLEAWRAAAPWAARYWEALAAEAGLDDAIRRVAEAAVRDLDRLGRALAPGAFPAPAPGRGGGPA